MPCDFCRARRTTGCHGRGMLPRRNTRLGSSAYRSLIGVFGWSRRHGPSATRLDRAFCDVGVAIDHLKVRRAPKIEQLGPRLVSVFAPDAEQWDAMVNFGIFP